MAENTDTLKSDEELETIFGTDSEQEGSEGDSDQSYTRQDSDNSLNDQGQDADGRTLVTGAQSSGEGETGSVPDADVEGDRSELDHETALKKLDAAERSSSFWQSKFDQSQQGTDNDFVNQIVEAAKTDQGLYDVLDNYFKGANAPQQGAQQAQQPAQQHVPDVFIPEDIGDPNTESGRYFQGEVYKVAKYLQDTSNNHTDSRLKLLEEEHREKGRQTFNNDAKSADPSLSDSDMEELVTWMQNPGNIPVSELVSVWKNMTGKSRITETKQELQKIKDNSLKPTTIAAVGGEGKPPKDDPDDELFVGVFGEVSPT